MPKKKKRLYRSVLGIPILVILAIAISILFSALYDWINNHTSLMFYLIIGSGLIVIITLFLNMVSLETVYKIIRKQLGAK